MSLFPCKRVIVPFDFSDASKAAVSQGRQLVDSADQLHVLHVLPNLSAADPGVIWSTVDDEQRKMHARDAMVKALAGEADLQGAELDVGVGDAGSLIVDLAEEIDADLIVIPSHGRTGVARLLLGSVAERVARLAPCPVLVLRGERA